MYTEATSPVDSPLPTTAKQRVAVHRYPIGTCVGLLIGVNKFENSNIQNLNNAVNDVNLVGKSLQESHNYDLGELLTDKNATKGAVEDRFRNLAIKSKKNKIKYLIVYFATHGLRRDFDDNSSDGPNLLIALHDSDPTQTQTFLSSKELLTLIREVGAQHVLLILDCCFAGAFSHASTRSPKLEKRQRLLEKRLAFFCRTSSMHVLTSASHTQRAIDKLFGVRGTGRNSPFAKTLARGLRGKADSAGDGIILGQDLYGYILRSFEKMNRHNQNMPNPLYWSMDRRQYAEFVLLSPVSNVRLRESSDTSNPYKSFASYTDKDNEAFFGRDEEIERLVTHVTDADGRGALPFLTVISAESGAGKSSLLRAGLIPALRQREQQIKIIVPAERRSDNGGFLTEELIKEEVARQLGREEEDWAIALKNWCLEHPLQTAVMCLDPLEDLLREETRGVYGTIDKLKALADWFREGLSNLRIVGCVRSDREDDFQLQDKSLMASIYRLPSPKWDALRQIVIRPAADRDIDFESPDLVERIIAEHINMPGVLPWLSYILSQLYLRYRDRIDNDPAAEPVFTMEDYEQVLQQKVQDLFNGQPAQRVCYEGLMLRLVVPGPRGLSRRKGERRYLFGNPNSIEIKNKYLDKAKILEGVIDVLVNEQRFLTTNRKSNPEGDVTAAWDVEESKIEVTHDFLINRLDIQAMIDRLGGDEIYHAYHKLLDGLSARHGFWGRFSNRWSWSDDDIFQAHFANPKNRDKFLFTPSEERFIDECKAARWWIRAIALGAACVLIGMTILIVLHNRSLKQNVQLQADRLAQQQAAQIKEAGLKNDLQLEADKLKAKTIDLEQKTREQEETEKRLQGSNQKLRQQLTKNRVMSIGMLVNIGREYLQQGQNNKALAKFIKAYKAGGKTPELNFLLSQSLERVQHYRSLGFEGPDEKVQDAVLSPGGTLLALLGEHQIVLWDLETGQRGPSYAMEQPGAVDFRPDSEVLAVSDSKEVVHLLKVKGLELKPLTPLKSADRAGILKLAFSDSGDTLWTHTSLGIGGWQGLSGGESSLKKLTDKNRIPAERLTGRVLGAVAQGEVQRVLIADKPQPDEAQPPDSGLSLRLWKWDGQWSSDLFHTRFQTFHSLRMAADGAFALLAGFLPASQNRSLYICSGNDDEILEGSRCEVLPLIADTLKIEPNLSGDELLITTQQQAALYDLPQLGNSPRLLGGAAGFSGGMFSPSGRQILTTSPDGFARLYSRGGGQPQSVLRHGGSGDFKGMLSLDGSLIFTYRKMEPAVRVWRPRTEQSAHIALHDRVPLNGLSLGSAPPDSDTCRQYSAMSLGGAGGVSTAWTLEPSRSSLQSWDLLTGVAKTDLAGRPELPGGRLSWLAFSADGRTLVAIDEGGAIHLSRTGQQPVRLSALGHAVEARLNQDASLLAVVLKPEQGPAGESSLRLFDLRGKTPRELGKSRSLQSPRRIAFGASGRWLVALSTSKELPVFAFDTSDRTLGRLVAIQTQRRPIADIDVHPTQPKVLVFYQPIRGRSGDGSKAPAPVAVPARIEIVSAAAGTLPLDTTSIFSELSSAIFSADGERVLTGHHNGQIGIWDPATSRSLRVLQDSGQPGLSSRGAICHIAVKQDDALVAAETLGGELLAWQLPKLERARERGPRLMQELEKLHEQLELEPGAHSPNQDPEALPDPTNGPVLSRRFQQTSEHGINLLAQGLLAILRKQRDLAKKHCDEAAAVFEQRRDPEYQAKARLCGLYVITNLGSSADREERKKQQEEAERRLAEPLRRLLLTCVPDAKGNRSKECERDALQSCQNQLRMPWRVIETRIAADPARTCKSLWEKIRGKK